MMRRAHGIGLGVSLALLAAACTKNIDEGTQIKEIAATEEKPAPAMPVAPTQQVRPDAQRALENYEKLLDLPQDPTARAETMRRLADLQLELDEASGGTNLAQSEARLRRSAELYNTVLTERPDAPTNDRVLYQLARAYQSLGELAKGEEALLRLTRDYPASPYVDDAHFRRAELLFRLEQFDEAAAEYQKVLAQKEASPFFESAQYKYGWAEYRQSNYEAALGVFLTILNRELPAGEQTDLKVAIDGVRAGKKDMAQDALRVVGLALTQLGGSEAATQYFAKHGEPAYSALIYSGLGTTLLEKKRYTDSAKSYEAYVAAHPQHALVPQFLGKSISAQELGGFIEPVVAAKERYVAHLDPGAAYWRGRAPDAEVMVSLRSHLEDLAHYYQARGQKPRDEGTAPAKDDFDEATRWYQRLLTLFPQDPKAAELRFLMAESMFDAGDTVGAAREYSRVVAEHPNYEKAPDAAFAALLAYQRNTEAVAPAQRDAALRQSVEAGLQLAEKYPQHPQALAALTRAAEDLYRLHEYDRAVAIAQRTLAVQPLAPDELRRTAWQVTADAHFSQKRYAPAEAAYAQLLPLLPADAANRAELTERQASSIYKQGEAARDASDFGTAAEAFLRVGRVVPGASIRATADYDAATMLIARQDWAQAAIVLEAFRTAYATSALLPEVDKKLAVVYESAGRPRDAALVLQRIAGRSNEDPATRRDAAWLAVGMLDKTADPRAAAEYESYLKLYPQPLDRAVEAREKLATYAGARKDEARRLQWLRETVIADANGGAGRTPATRQSAARAQLELARVEAQKAAKMPLKAPLKQSLPPKKEAMEKAIASLNKASDYGLAEVTTAATYELGLLYQGLSQSLLKSERPRKMSALEREQYGLLLEEQAFPFEEKSIQFHEANLQRVAQGNYNEWVGRSLEQLAVISPGRYAKREQTVDLYEALPAQQSAQLGPRQTLPGSTAKKKEPASKAKPGTKTTPKPAPVAPAPEPEPASPLSPRDRYEQALNLLKTNQLAAAETAFIAATKDFPTFTGAQANLGIVYAKLNRKADARIAFGKAVALDAGNAIAHNWLGVLAREAGELVRAEQTYLAALAAQPGQAQAQLNLAILYDLHLKRSADAIAAYKRYDELTGRKELRVAAWIAALQAPATAATAATVRAPAPAPTAAPAPRPVLNPARKPGATS